MMKYHEIYETENVLPYGWIKNEGQDVPELDEFGNRIVYQVHNFGGDTYAISWDYDFNIEYKIEYDDNGNEIVTDIPEDWCYKYFRVIGFMAPEVNEY